MVGTWMERAAAAARRRWLRSWRSSETFCSSASRVISLALDPRRDTCRIGKGIVSQCTSEGDAEGERGGGEEAGKGPGGCRRGAPTSPAGSGCRQGDAHACARRKEGDGDHGRVSDHGTGGLSSRGVPSRDSRVGKCAGAISKCSFYYY